MLNEQEILKDTYFGSWVLKRFNSRESVNKNTTLIGRVNRKLAIGNVMQDFRHFKNKNNFDRFLMIGDDASTYHNKEVVANVTGTDFFLRFLDGMLKYKEITEPEYNVIIRNLEQLGIKIKPKPKKEVNVYTRLTEEDLEELNNI